MIRKTLIAIALSSLLTGCAGTPGMPGPTPGGPNDPAAIIANVQAIARQACKFVPTAETILSLISTFTGTSPFTSTASAIADAICASVTATSSPSLTAARGGPPRVNGVAIRGKFVR